MSHSLLLLSCAAAVPLLSAVAGSRKPHHASHANPAIPPAPAITHPKLKGEWVEAVFLIEALARGLHVCKPWGDCAPFDFITERAARMARIQVRSAWQLNNGRFYVNCKPSQPGAATFDATQIDFMACFVVPLRAWYIIPVTALTADQDHIYFFPVELDDARSRPSQRTQSTEQFRNRWDLLN